MADRARAEWKDKPLLRMLRYASSADGTRPLLADLCFVPTPRRLPLIVVLHGYNGDRRAVRPDILRLAARGFFAVAPDLRGRGGSGGRWDSGGLDVLDIRDAVLAALQKYADQIDPANLNVLGYSGGGGNAIACFVRFPDLFRVAVSFFGIPDYAAWHRSRGRPDCNRIMEATLGGPPRRLPALYAARNAIPAAGNNGQTRLHLFWDAAETACPGAMDEAFVRASRAAGHRNIVTHRSRVRDALRWHHGYSTQHPELIAAEERFLPEMLRGSIPPPELPHAGRLVVPGYLVTRRFALWLSPAKHPELLGQSGTAEVDYTLDVTGARFQVRALTPGHHLRIDTPVPGSPFTMWRGNRDQT